MTLSKESSAQSSNQTRLLSTHPALNPIRIPLKITSSRKKTGRCLICSCYDNDCVRL